MPRVEQRKGRSDMIERCRAMNDKDVMNTKYPLVWDERKN